MLQAESTPGPSEAGRIRSIEKNPMTSSGIEPAPFRNKGGIKLSESTKSRRMQLLIVLDYSQEFFACRKNYTMHAYGIIHDISVMLIET
jgi:hypothetical protein